MLIHIDKIAQRKSGIEEWEACSWEKLDGDDCLVTGGIPRLIKSGKNKGRKTWRDSSITIFCVTKEELSDERKRYEKETGLCSYCFGDGKTIKSWNVKTGTEYKDCNNCNGTGKCK